MGNSASISRAQLIEPEDIEEFRKFTEPGDHVVIPEVPEKRKVTDFKFTFIFAAFIILLLPFLIYTFVHSDLDRFTHGYDNCGNVCGKKNSFVDGISCSGKDMTDRPFLKYQDNFQLLPEGCVNSCNLSDYEVVMHKCFPSSKNNFNLLWTDITDDLNESAGYIVLFSLIGFGLSVCMLLLFRYFVEIVVWVILVGSILGMIVLTIFLWYRVSVSGLEDSNFFYGLAIGVSVSTVIFIIVFVSMVKRIKLIIQLFKEAINVIFGIPIILFEPLLTLVANVVLLFICALFIVLILNSGFLQLIRYNLYEYIPNDVMMFTLWFHVIICLWMCQFILGCQHMVVSGAVSAYYFARDKATVTSPIYNSFYNLVRYHLGTVAFGSLIITIVAIIKALIRILANNRYLKILIDCCLGVVEDLLKFLSKNAYIQTAMHGQPFLKSGQRAVRLLAANALSTIAVNSVGDFVLGMTKLLIVVVTVGIGILMNKPEIEHFWAAIFISALVTLIIAECFFAVFETAIDTIFLCFCEDSLMNDGTEHPYYMTTNLMVYMEEVKKPAEKKDSAALSI